ncbi:hypothetical protein GCM10010499_19130 [Streptomyces thermoviolaceus subsp. apingens]|nr:hypothetical protein GCM10010499_19130 [Streptomyces thermoviolaceus subsp. apingens]
MCGPRRSPDEQDVRTAPPPDEQGVRTAPLPRRAPGRTAYGPRGIPRAACRQTRAWPSSHTTGAAAVSGSATPAVKCTNREG